MTRQDTAETSPKWVEVNIHLADPSRTDEALVGFVAPFVENCKSEGLIQSWHFFREPEIRLRFMGEEAKIDGLRKTLDASLTDLEKSHSDLYEKHVFGAHGIAGQEYVGEGKKEEWGNDWNTAIRYYEDGSETALEILSRKQPDKPLQLHAERHTHLFLNQLGYTYQKESLLHRRMYVGYLLLSKGKASPALQNEFKVRLEAIEQSILGQA